MPGKKLTARKRAELKKKKLKQQKKSNFSVLIIFFIIIIGGIAGAYFIITNIGTSENNQGINGDGTNNAPVANKDYFVVPKNAYIYRITALDNDYDLDNDQINITSISTPGFGSNEIMLDGTISYSPNVDFSGSDSFKYTISDGKKKVTSTVNIVVTETFNPVAFIDTSMGLISVELYENEVPNTVNNFINLANDKFYDGLVFHRVIDGFMIQSGGFEPDGTTKESPYGNIEFESNDAVKHVDGAISMASTGSMVGGSSQFFICDGEQNYLDGNYAAFGVVLDGIEIVRAIASVDTTVKNGMEDWPVEDVIINGITINRILT